MSLKKLGFAMLAVLALAAVFANTAMATATESKGFWYKGSTKLAEGTKEPVTCALSSESITFTSTVGSVPVRLKATSVSCAEATIFNKGGFASTGKTVVFGPTQVLEPSGCKIEGESFKTEPLVGQIYMEGTKVLGRSVPASGTTFAEVTIKGCAIAGTYPVKGSWFTEMVSATNTAATAQKVRFSEAINKAAGGELTFAGNPAAITGEGTVKLTSGGEWKVNES